MAAPRGQQRRRILFNVSAEAANPNAQSQNAQSIAARLPPDEFHVTMFGRGNPRADLAEAPNVHVIQLPSRRAFATVAATLATANFDVLCYPPWGMMAELLRIVPVSKHSVTSYSVECTADSILSSPHCKSLVRAIRRADARTSVSEAVRTSLRDRFGLDSKVLPLGVEVSRWQPRNQRTDRTNVLFVGSITPRKRVHLILDCARAISGKNARFNIVGPPLDRGAYRDRLADEARISGLGHVRFLDAVPPNRVPLLMAESDILVLPSRLEGAPKVLLEAAVAGIPAVIFNDYRSDVVINGITGIVVSNDCDFVAAVRHLVERPTERAQMGVAARRVAIARDWDVVVPMWADHFRTIRPRASRP